MSEVMDQAVTILKEKIGDGFSGSAKVVISGHGSIVIDGGGVRVAEDDADVTLTADADTFQDLLAGAIDPASAFMSGRLAVDGDMSQAMALGAALA